MPPVEFENNKKKLLALNTSFIILKIFDINDVEGTFDIQFMVHTQWFDKDLQFEYLKLDIDENSLSEKLYKQIWVPDIEFDDIDIDSSMSVYRKHIFVREDFAIISKCFKSSIVAESLEKCWSFRSGLW